MERKCPICNLEAGTCGCFKETTIEKDGKIKLIDIVGNAVGKRAAFVALAGSHTLTLVSTDGTGADMLKEYLDKKYQFPVRIVKPCPCGNGYEHCDFTNLQCDCSKGAIARYRDEEPFKKAMRADIVVEFIPPTERQVEQRNHITGNTWKKNLHTMFKGDMLRTTKDLINSHPMGFSSKVEDFGWNKYNQRKVLEIAETIARVNRTSMIGMIQLTEVFLYEEIKYKYKNKK